MFVVTLLDEGRSLALSLHEISIMARVSALHLIMKLCPCMFTEHADLACAFTL